MKNKIFKISVVLSALVIVVCGFSSIAYAIPEIQLYIPGSTYVHDDASDWIEHSWFTENSAFEIQVIVAAPFSDLNLVVAVPDEYGSITVNGVTYSRPASPAEFIYGSPVIGTKNKDGFEYMPSHGVYDTYYKVINIGEVKEEDLTENVHDMVDGSEDKDGKIFHFDFVKTGFSKAHFDAYGDGKCAPFSHDAEDGPLPPKTPEPATMSLLGLGIFGLLGFKRRKNKGK